MKFTESFTDYKLEVFDRGVRLPEVAVSPEDWIAAGVKPNTSNVNYLKKLCWKSLLEKIATGEIKQNQEECKARLQTEFAVFEKTGIIDYLLLLIDFIKFADSDGIPRGIARGSAAGSLSLYLLGITKINPLNHNLNFTRFLSEARAKPTWIDGVMYCDGKTMCDVDLDFSFLGRPRLIEFVEKKYAGKSCKISTLQYLTAKMALKETLKLYLRYNETDAKIISDNVESLHGKMDNLEQTYSKSKEFRAWADSNPRAYEIALGLEGLIRTSGIHASGMLVSYYPLLDLMPLQLSDSDEIVSAYDMDIALTVFVKADLLGLRTLDIMDECIKEIRKDPNNTFNQLEQIDINDPVIYNYYSSCDRYLGLFQIEAGLTKQVVTRVQPKNIDQLAACLSISRPGALAHIDDFVKFVKTGEFKKVHPKVDEILFSTGGILLYQEQVNRICQELYNMSAVDADDVRRCIGKKDTKGMEKWEPVLHESGEKYNIPTDVTNWFWQTCIASSSYLFNASHCYSYGYVCAYTTYLKAKFPLQFYLGVLKMAQYESKPLLVINEVQKEMMETGFKLMPPNIYKSQADYSIDGNKIFTGLTGVKGISDKALDKLRLYKKENANKFEMFESIKAAKIPVNIMTALIMSGCMDDYGISRSLLVLELEIYNLLTEREKPLIARFGPEYNWDLCKIIHDCAAKLDIKGKPLIKESRLETLRRNYEDCYQKFVANSKHEALCTYVMETTYLGFSYSTTLKKIYSEFCKDLVTVSEASSEIQQAHVRLAVEVVEVEKKISRVKKTPYLWMLVKDETGEITAMCFGQDRLDELTAFNGREVSEGDILILNAKKGKDVLFVDGFSIQENPIVIKKSDLKKSQTAEPAQVA